MTFNASKFISLASAGVILTSSIFLYGAYAYREDYPPIPQLRLVKQVLTNEVGVQSYISEHLQPSRGQGSGVTVDNAPADGALIFMAGFFDNENQLRLMERGGAVVKQWSLNYFEHFPEQEERLCDVQDPLQVDVHGAHVNSQGEAVFNYEYCGTVKLDQCGEIVWTLPKWTHHSIVPSEAGGYWLLGRQQWEATEEPNRFPPFSSSVEPLTIHEDTLLRISESGEVLEETSIPELMRRSNLEALLTATGDNFGPYARIRSELVHANKVAELGPDVADMYPMFEAGDLAVSMRQLNLIMIVDPVTKEVKWHQTGPWLRQHDPEFRSDGRISVFNNNVYRNAYDADGYTLLSTPRVTNIVGVQPTTGETEVIFGEKPGQEMLSVIRGEHELLANDGMLITEFDAGRVLEVNSKGEIVWEYVNGYDDEFVGEIANSTIYPKGYFKMEWEECDQ